MFRFDSYRSVNGRCLVSWQTFRGFEMPRAKVIEQIEAQLGFVPIEVDLIEEARSLVGTGEFERRVEESKAPQVINCSSLMAYLFGLLGVDIPRFAFTQRDFGQSVYFHKMEAGDLIFTSGIEGRYEYYHSDPKDGVGHVGLIVGDGTVIHAFNPDPEAQEPPPAIYQENLKRFLAGREFRGACRILPCKEDRIVLEIPDTENIRWSDDIFCRFSTTLVAGSKSSFRVA